jgi:hypothetical protein
MVRNVNCEEIYKTVYNNPSVFIQWLDEIKCNGVDNEKRVRNPLYENGRLIYTNKDGLYSTLWNACVNVMQGNYDFTDIPRPMKVIYNNKRWLNYLQDLRNQDPRYPR